MSYDVSLVINTGKIEHEVVDCGNYTSNVYKMYRKAFKSENGIKELIDKKADYATIILPDVIKDMEDNAEEYKALNPSNGWGDYEGALAYLKTILKWCIIHPNCTIKISY